MCYYISKVSQAKHVMPKSEVCGGTSISSHGTAVGIGIPEFVWAPIVIENGEMVGGVVDYRNIPADSIPGKMYRFNLIIACNDSKQDTVQTYVTQAMELTITKKLFCHITEGHEISDNTSNYNCTMRTLTKPKMRAWTGIGIVSCDRCEAGEGACLVNHKNSHIKAFIVRNIHNGIQDVVCANRYVLNITSNGGLPGVLVAVLDSTVLSCSVH